MENKEKRASKNEEFIKKVKKENGIKHEYKLFIVNDYNYYDYYNYYNNEQEYYYSVR